MEGSWQNGEADDSAICAEPLVLRFHRRLRRLGEPNAFSISSTAENNARKINQKITLVAII